MFDNRINQNNQPVSSRLTDDSPTDFCFGRMFLNFKIKRKSVCKNIKNQIEVNLMSFDYLAPF